MKKLKGISVYCGLDDYPLDSNLEYLELAKSKGVDFVFSSAHIDEAKSFNEFETIVNKCYDLGLQLVVDASKKAFEKVEKFLDKCVLRLDYGFSKDEIVEFTNKYPLIELNATKMLLLPLEVIFENSEFVSSQILFSHSFSKSVFSSFPDATSDIICLVLSLGVLNSNVIISFLKVHIKCGLFCVKHFIQ